MSLRHPPRLWSDPVPVRASSFVAERRTYARHAIEVDLGRVRAFALDDFEDERVAWFDHQLAPSGSWPGRHGAGRAGVHDGRYVKGIGRTFAMGNWNDPAERYHGSGHLSVGSAIRERAVTLWLRARGLGDAIVPCEAMLLREMTTDERRHVAAGRTSARPDATPADAHMAALTVKPSGWARPSNVLWALETVSPSPRRVADLFLAMERFALPSPREAGARLEGEPRAIARALRSGFENGLRNLDRLFEHGVSWLYLDNNVTLDGRVVDLETPLVVGSPFVGVWSISGARAASSARWTLGFEQLSLALEWQRFVLRLTSGIERLGSAVWTDDPRVRGFVRSVGRELRRSLRCVFDDERTLRRTVGAIKAALGLGTRDGAKAEQLARAELAHLRGAPMPNMAWEKEAFVPADPVPRAKTGPYARPRAWLVRAPFVGADDRADGVQFREKIATLGAATAPTSLFAGLRSAR
ncbi:MAG: hypothetical protein IT379_28835 [Deltaproteobacteria bacterium]|nr:hypothetical protein [Deltaproteobacteria bacterium]